MSQRKIGILSGGAGTRIWPLSRKFSPKQYYDLSGSGKPLLIDTVERLEKLGQVSVITTADLEKSSLGLLKKFKKTAGVLAEPEARNTAPAIALFTHISLRKDPESTIALFPADHLIKNNEAFYKAIDLAFETAAKGYVCTLGIQPTYPSEAYGYIEMEGKEGPQKVTRFIEKPNKAKAEELLATEKVAWNAGMFVFSAKVMAQKFETFMPEMWSQLQELKSDNSNLGEVFSRLEKTSIDYGIMEKLDDLYCIPCDIGWTDIGSWEEIAKLKPESAKKTEEQASGNYHLSLGYQDKHTAYIGCQDIITIDTPDALLVLKKGHGQSVKNVVEKLKQEDVELTENHKFEERPWGRFEILMDTDSFKSKRIIVYPGQKLSYQSHKKRGEHWTVVKGQAEVTLDGNIHKLGYGEHIHIPLGAKHRMANPGTENMEFIEVQTGSYFGEDDIERFEDDYGRS